MIVWYMLTAAVFILAAVRDIKERRIGRTEVLLIIAAGALRPGRDGSGMLRAAMTAAFVYALLLAVYLYSAGRGKKVIGGGDVRFIAAAAFLLTEKEMITAMLGTAGILFFHIIICRLKRVRCRTIPVAAYVSPSVIGALFVTVFIKI